MKIILFIFAILFIFFGSFYFLFFSGDFLPHGTLDDDHSMDRGMASNPSGHQDASSLMERLRVLMTYAEDRNAKVSFLQSIITKNQEEVIPSYVPRDLILEAKI